jgi:glycogen(starch) synthase
MKNDAYTPKVSIIINTDGRAKSLSNCLESLQYLKYPNFEVVVVAGPTRDGTHELCESYGDHIVYADCPERNLSMSRNISIQISSGEFVGFLDDDSIPEPEWLSDVMPAFKDETVGVAGGFLHDHTGKTYQWTFGTVDRYGAADTSYNRPTPEFNFPFSFHYPHVMANSVFRRKAIVEVGGFDEEYEYFLDESDIILRFVDSGWKIAQLNNGFIHHKYMPSHIRNESRVLTSWYSVIKNKTYFSLQNGAGHTTVQDVLSAIQTTISDFRTHVKWAINESILGSETLDRFEQEVDQALKHGLQRGIAGVRRLVKQKTLEGKTEFRNFPSLSPKDGQRCYIFLSQTYPPGSVGGIGRYVHHLAKGIASLGHQVHVLTTGKDHDRVDFESGVWVHRICIKNFPVPTDIKIPQHLWDYSHTMYQEVEEIASRRQVVAVCAPIWDIEGIAFLHKGKFPLITSLHTTLATYLESNSAKASEQNFMRDFAQPVLELEKKLMTASAGIIANSHAIAQQIEQAYGIRFATEKLAFVPHGIEDWQDKSVASDQNLSSNRLNVTFIGRMEPRKGADVFLELVPSILEKYPQAYISIVGNDQIPDHSGTTMHSRFAQAYPDLRACDRLKFFGEVDDETLRHLYQAADIIVAPSRFESFGLVHAEAMMFGKAVIGCNAGGMKEVIEHNVTGLLTEPGDATSLLQAIERLITDRELRKSLGQNARLAFLEKFSVNRMTEGVIASLEKFSK